MRDLTKAWAEPMRVRGPKVQQAFGSEGDAGNGLFVVPSPIDRQPMTVLASNGLGWEHVSVSRRNRPPNWVEMCHVKHLFFQPDETVMQLHVPAADHVNFAPNCLHLWRPLDAEIPRPPAEMVGPKTSEEETGGVS